MNGPLRRPCGYTPALAKKGICGVMAVAVCAEVPYEMAFEACRVNLPGFRKRFGGATYPDQLTGALTDLGVTFAYNPPSVVKGFNMSVERFVNEATSWGVTYMLTTCNHALTIRDRQVIDQSQLCDIGQFKGRQAKVEAIWTIKSNKPFKLEISA